MHRHRITAVAPGGKRYTLALVRFRTDDQARELAGRTGHGQIKEVDAINVSRETFDLQGMTTSRKDVTEP